MLAVRLTRVIWQRSCLYRLWVIGGLLAIAAVVLYVGLNTKPGDPPPYPIFGAAVGIYLLGIIVMQAVDLVRKREPESVAAGDIPATHEQLMAALTLPGADAARSQRGADGSRRFSIALFIPTALMAILLPLGGYLYVSGAVTAQWQPFGPTGIGIPVAALPGLAVLLLLLIALPRNLKRARALTDDYNAGLGLKITTTPSVILLPRVGTQGVGAHTVGPTTFEGQRYGRHVIVEANAGTTAVLVGQSVPTIRIAGNGGRLVLDEGPQWVAATVAQIPPDERWKHMRLEGSNDGLIVRRKGSAVDSDWMLDLWLAEVLLDAKPSDAG